MLISSTDGVDSVVQFLTVLLIFAIVLLVTFFVTRWVGNIQKMQNKGNNVEVVESARISSSSYVQILKIGTKFVAIAVSKENVTFLCELSPDDIHIKEDGNVSSMDFGSIFNKVKNGITAKNEQVGDIDREEK